LRVLVTGATGFVGRHVVNSFGRRGHDVLALVRPAHAQDHSIWEGDVQVRTADLRTASGLADALRGVDAVVHLAAQVTGSDEARFTGTAAATEHLVDAMRSAGVRRLVVASSYAVYDWSRAGPAIAVDSPLEDQVYERDGYAVAKLWQERVVQRAAERGDIDLTVLRPGYVWGGDELVPGVGQTLGAVQLVFGPLAHPPLTYVENCADAFVTATEDQRALGRTYNVVDAQAVTTWRYARDFMRLSGEPVRCLPVPYGLAYGLVRVVHFVARLVLGHRMRLPSIFIPRRFEARFRPARHSRGELERDLAWRPPHSYVESLHRAFGVAR